MAFVFVLLMALLAFANGANDNSKGVATLVGYGAATPRKALVWAMATTLLGALFSFWFAGGLIQSFSTGMFARETVLGTAFFAAVLVGAIGWALIATVTGMPVSTTHVSTGAIIGAGLRNDARKVRWGTVGQIALSWVVTLPVSALIACVAVLLIRGVR